MMMRSNPPLRQTADNVVPWHFVQVLIVLVVMILVWESHLNAGLAAEQLAQFREDESLLLLQLQRLERQSIQLHEGLTHMAKSSLRGTEPEEKAKKNTAGDDVENFLLNKQTQQLQQMEEELNHEVRTLQNRIQQSARNHILTKFGEGPVKVVLELDFGSDSATTEVQILLWHDTPHAAWTWLEEIERNIWDGASFEWQDGRMIDATPEQEDPVGGKLEFMEHSQHSHEPWTVGLRESEYGKLNMYINLQDNTRVHKQETCVGRVFSGFQAVQQTLERTRESGKKGPKKTVRIRKATAVHVARGNDR